MVTACAEGKYYSDDLKTCVDCEPGYACHNGVKTYCSAGTYSLITGASSCTSCESKYYCSGGSSRLSCASKTSNCLDCNKINGVCSSCNSRYYLTSSNSCASCSSNCRTCSSSSYCEECTSGYKLSNGSCIADCPSNCQSCDSSGKCTLCASGYNVTQVGTCVYGCPKRGYAFDGICVQCADGYAWHGYTESSKDIMCVKVETVTGKYKNGNCSVETDTYMVDIYNKITRFNLGEQADCDETSRFAHIVGNCPSRVNGAKCTAKVIDIYGLVK